MSSGQAPSSGAPPQGGASFAPQQAHQPQQTGNQNLNQIVTDYLVKRGYVQTERVFRREIALGPDGKPARNPLDTDPARFKRAWILLLGHVDSCLDVFKFELSKLLWPVFVYSFIKLIEEGNTAEAQDFLNHVFTYFKKHHEDDLKVFQTITQKAQVLANDTTRLYKENKYQIPLNQHVNDSLYSFLERKYDDGGSVIADILNDSIALHRVDRGPINAFSFEAIYSRGQNVDLQDADVHEGIPGHYTGVTNRDIIDQNQVLKLGPMPMENDLQNDVRAELEELDSKGPPTDGRPTLVDEFDRKIKREESADGPSRSDLPLPPSRARDVIMEIQKVRENRDRFKIEGRTGGVPPAVSICMFTFHNTLGAYNCIDFSKDYRLVATGTEDSYIRVWDLAGKPLTSKLPSEKDLKVNNRKLIGHSAAIMSVHFSDSINPPSQNIISEADSDTGPRFLISASMDGQIRLWSLQVWSCLAIYKGHDGPVTRCLWSPHGHYFASGGWDKTVRVWTQDHASHVRLLVGHDTCISEICWHPNGMYIFSASDETDKTIRMWSITTGQCVRLFTGHTDFISALAVAPNGRILASADLGGTIRFWDIDKGTLIKRSRGHQKGGIWSLSFSVESTVLVSGGHDCTVRIWDVAQTTDGKSNTGEAGAGQLDTTLANAQGGSAMAAGSSGPTGGAVGGKKKGKEATVTPDQVSCFPTKRTPVIKVEFSRMNLVVAGGWFEPGR